MTSAVRTFAPAVAAPTPMRAMMTPRTGHLRMLPSVIAVLMLMLVASKPFGIPSARAQGTPGERTAGQVRTLTDQTDPTLCYQLGQADKAQDQAAGVALNLDASVDGGQGSNALTRYEDGRPVAKVVVTGTTTKACGQAYLEGYVGNPPPGTSS